MLFWLTSSLAHGVFSLQLGLVGLNLKTASARRRKCLAKAGQGRLTVMTLCLMVPLLLAGPGARSLEGQYPRCATTPADDAFRSIQESDTTASSSFDSLQTMTPRQEQDAGKTVTVLNGGQNIKADSQQKIRDTYRLIGHVEITYRQMKVTADEATFDSATSEVEARGHVIFTDPEAHLEADYTRYNLKTEIGDFSNAHGYVHPRIRPRPHILATENPFYLQATRVRRVSEDLFLLQGARLTTCENENKGWSVASRNARVEVGDKVVSHDDIFRLLGVPVFYSPLLVNSVKPAPRQTGFLLPEIGNSTQKG